MYEISEPNEKFYSVERAGYFNVGQMITDAVGDMIQLGAFTLSNLSMTDSGGTVITSGSWPPKERLITVTAPGVGYYVGDTVQIKYTALSANANLTITGTHPQNGSVTSVSISDPGDLYLNPQSAGQATAWRKQGGDSVTPYTANITTANATITIQGNLSNQTGVSPAVVAPSLATFVGSAAQVPPALVTATSIAASKNTALTRVSTSGLMRAGYNETNGVDGLLHWPRTGAWTNIEYSVAITKFFVGQEVVFNQFGISSSPLSSIPEGTTITGIYPIAVPSGLQYRPSLEASGVANAPQPTTMYDFFTEGVKQYTWFAFSNPVTLHTDDVIVARGVGLEVDDTTNVTPAGFKVIVEAMAAADPLNDQIGVLGTVVSATSASTTVLIEGLTTGNNFRPFIYAGQSVTSTVTPGTVVGSVTVVSVVSTGTTTATVTLSSQQSLDAGEELHFVFAEVQPWRLAFDVQVNTLYPLTGPQVVNVYAATANQLDNFGRISTIWSANGKIKLDQAGIMGALPSYGTNATGGNTAPFVAFTVNAAVASEGFINRQVRVAENPEIYPFNYGLTMTNRGIFFGVWEGTWSTMQKSAARSATDGDNFFNWFLIQRPVNRYTGQVLTTGRCPVFCINSVGYKYWKFIVREDDILHPSLGDPENKRDYITLNASGNAYVQASTAIPYRVPADAHTQDSFAILNTSNQIALTEDSKYLISFLHNLTTPRFRYSEELDMIGQTSADVCMAGSDISITAYNESGPRVYRSLPANGQYNTGLRIAVLKKIPI